MNDKLDCSYVMENLHILSQIYNDACNKNGCIIFKENRHIYNFTDKYVDWNFLDHFLKKGIKENDVLLTAIFRPVNISIKDNLYVSTLTFYKIVQSVNCFGQLVCNFILKFIFDVQDCVEFITEYQIYFVNKNGVFENIKENVKYVAFNELFMQ